MAADDRLIALATELLAEVRQMRLENNERLDRAIKSLEQLDDQTKHSAEALNGVNLSVTDLNERIGKVLGYGFFDNLKALFSSKES